MPGASRGSVLRLECLPPRSSRRSARPVIRPLINVVTVLAPYGQATEPFSVAGSLQWTAHHHPPDSSALVAGQVKRQITPEGA
jgi:hypothetical protein